MRQGGGTVYDGVSASGDATGPADRRRRRRGRSTSTTIPGFGDVAPFLQDAPHYIVDGNALRHVARLGRQPADVQHGQVTPAPTSWDVVFDPASGGYSGHRSPRTTAPSTSPTRRCTSRRTARAGHHRSVRAHPDAVRRGGRAAQGRSTPFVGKYWACSAPRSTTSRAAPRHRHDVAVPGEHAQGERADPVEAIVPERGHDRLGRHVDDVATTPRIPTACSSGWPGCSRPRSRRRSPSTSARRRPTPRPASTSTSGYGGYALPGLLRELRRQRPDFYGSIAFWKTPLADCGDARGQTCIDYSDWTSKWTRDQGLSPTDG